MDGGTHQLCFWLLMPPNPNPNLVKICVKIVCCDRGLPAMHMLFSSRMPLSVGIDSRTSVHVFQRVLRANDLDPVWFSNAFVSFLFSSLARVGLFFIVLKRFLSAPCLSVDGMMQRRRCSIPWIEVSSLMLSSSVIWLEDWGLIWL